MGIYDREYYRSESRGANFFSSSPVCKTLILINVGIFVIANLSLVEGELLRGWFAATSEGIFSQGHVWQLLTATFLHFSLLHLVLNMYFLWIVGGEMEAMYGPRDFLALYLAAAVVSTLGWAVVDSFASRGNPMIGASGAVLAVAVVYTLFFPKRELLFMFVIPVEMWLFLSVIVAIDVFQMLNGSETRTAVASHVTGAAYGFLFQRFDLRWSKLSWLRVGRPRLRIVPADPPYEKPSIRPSSGPTWSPNMASVSKPAVTTAVVPQEQLDARLDEVLAKIAREGRQGLSEEENRILQEASRRARNRRSDRL
ncbi:MAG: rhomboid family intramembrane serine protease [Isosphaeraceae bacterium]